MLKSLEKFIKGKKDDADDYEERLIPAVPSVLDELLDRGNPIYSLDSILTYSLLKGFFSQFSSILDEARLFERELIQSVEKYIHDVFSVEGYLFLLDKYYLWNPYLHHIWTRRINKEMVIDSFIRSMTSKESIPYADHEKPSIQAANNEKPLIPSLDSGDKPCAQIGDSDKPIALISCDEKPTVLECADSKLDSVVTSSECKGCIFLASGREHLSFSLLRTTNRLPPYLRAILRICIVLFRPI